jgi:hypothetical protein
MDAPNKPHKAQHTLAMAQGIAQCLLRVAQIDQIQCRSTCGCRRMSADDGNCRALSWEAEFHAENETACNGLKQAETRRRRRQSVEAAFRESSSSPITLLDELLDPGIYFGLDPGTTLHSQRDRARELAGLGEPPDMSGRKVDAFGLEAFGGD